MSLPRRVPWSSQEEYEEVFSLLFSSNGDLEAQRRAVDRVRDLQKLHPKRLYEEHRALLSWP